MNPHKFVKGMNVVGCVLIAALFAITTGLVGLIVWLIRR